MWNPPGPGIEPVSPSLAGRFLTTGPTGRSWHLKCKWNLLVTVHCATTSQTKSVHLLPRFLSPLPLYFHSLPPAYSYCSTSLLWHFHLTFEKCFHHSCRIKWLWIQVWWWIYISGLWDSNFLVNVETPGDLQSDILNNICDREGETVAFLNWLNSWEVKSLLRTIFICSPVTWIPW